MAYIKNFNSTPLKAQVPRLFAWNDYTRWYFNNLTDFDAATWPIAKACMNLCYLLQQKIKQRRRRRAGWPVARGETPGRYGGETPPNDEKVVIFRATIWLLAYLWGNSECLVRRCASLNAYFFSGGHMQGLKLVFTCNTLCSCTLKLCNCI